MTTPPVVTVVPVATCSHDRCDGPAVVQVVHPLQGRPVFACIIHKPLAVDVVRFLIRNFRLRLFIKDLADG